MNNINAHPFKELFKQNIKLYIIIFGLYLISYITLSTMWTFMGFDVIGGRDKFYLRALLAIPGMMLMPIILPISALPMRFIINSFICDSNICNFILGALGLIVIYIYIYIYTFIAFKLNIKSQWRHLMLIPYCAIAMIIYYKPFEDKKMKLSPAECKKAEEICFSRQIKGFKKEFKDCACILILEK